MIRIESTWKILSGILSECQTVLIRIRPDVSSDLIWVQIVCKGYQQTALEGKELMFIRQNSTTHALELILKAPRKNASEKWCLLKSSAANNCLTLLTNWSKEANRVDRGAVWSGSTLVAKRLLKHFSRREKKTTFVGIGPLRVYLHLNIFHSIFILLKDNRQAELNLIFTIILPCTAPAPLRAPL